MLKRLALMMSMAACAPKMPPSQVDEVLPPTKQQLAERCGEVSDHNPLLSLSARPVLEIMTDGVGGLSATVECLNVAAEAGIDPMASPHRYYHRQHDTYYPYKNFVRIRLVNALLDGKARGELHDENKQPDLSVVVAYQSVGWDPSTTVGLHLIQACQNWAVSQMRTEIENPAQCTAQESFSPELGACLQRDFARACKEVLDSPDYYDVDALGARYVQAGCPTFYVWSWSGQERQPYRLSCAR